MARRVARQRDRRRGGHLPAGLRRTRHGRGIDPQKQQRHARLLGGKRQAAAGSQVQLAHRPPAFDHHRSQRRTAQALHRRAQQGHGIGQHAHQPLARLPPQIAPPLALKHAAQTRGTARSQPQHRTRSTGKARHQGHGESADSCRILDLRRIDFMDPGACQSACHSAHQTLWHGQARTAGRRVGSPCVMARKEGNDSHVFLLCSSPAEDQAGFPRFQKRQIISRVPLA